jgi:hypothetical protein
MNGLTQNANDDWRPSASWATLRARAALVERTRLFFAARGLLEIDTPMLQGGANLDHGVLPFRLLADGAERFLPTSPEHPLKRLLAAGAGDLWTLAPAFRRQERGRLHSPEFRMLEWYRLGWDDRRLLAETVSLLAELTGLTADLEVLSWREAFRRHAGLDPARAWAATPRWSPATGGRPSTCCSPARSSPGSAADAGRHWSITRPRPAPRRSCGPARTATWSRPASRSTATASSWPTATMSSATGPS